MATSLERFNSVEKLKPHTDGIFLERIPKRFEQISLKDVKIYKTADVRKGNKLESLDAHRIMTVFEDSIRKVELLTLLPYIIENMNAFQCVLGKEIIDEMNIYDHFEQSYTKVLSRARRESHAVESGQSQTSVSSNGSEDKRSNKSVDGMSSTSEHVISIDASHELITIQYHLKQSLKSILRFFRKNPSALTIINGKRNERASETNIFIDKLHAYKDVMRLKLCTTQEEETKRQRKSNFLINKQKRSQTIITNLENELKQIEDGAHFEISKRNSEIKSLQSAIGEIEQTSSALNDKVMAEANKSETGELKSFETKKLKYQQDLFSMRQTVQTSIEAHRTSELIWRKRKFKLETEVENWIAKYDTDMTERQDELDALLLAHKDEKNQLDELAKHFEIMKKDYLEIIEERRIAMEKREEAERLLQRMVKAAIVIQSMWRSYKCRKALLKGKKKGKKGKGKKKKR